MICRRHDMPFGADLRPDGTTRFRLWAPGASPKGTSFGASQVDLVLQGANGQSASQPMTPTGQGWLETGAIAPAGTRYHYRIGGLAVPDPASRYNPDDVHGASEVIDPEAFTWEDGAWRGRPWEDAVIYELHVGTFSPEGTFAGVTARLDYLAQLGVTAVELMPVADFPGSRNWGYDGVLPFAPDSSYGRPEDLKRLVQQAHARDLMVLLDVVYNHFGPEGNYLHAYAGSFFTERHSTPWGAAINFDGADSRPVRDFFIHNALYWLEEYHLDGLRLDAVHAIADDSRPHILEELAQRVRSGPGQERPLHLILENDRNQARYLQREAGRPRRYTAQWNDDLHHALHVLITGERDGYYADYAQAPARHLGRCLAQGFAYQGEPSPYRGGAPRGEPSGGLPPGAFVSFLQTHDQVGNRALGERLTALADETLLELAVAVVLLSPHPPLLFMGEEFAAATPFLFFCDFGSELAQAVTAGRRREFARFARFADPDAQAAIPDPNHPATFDRSRLDWLSAAHPRHRRWLDTYRALLALRRQHIAPHLAGMKDGGAEFETPGPQAVRVQWTLGDGSLLTLLANFGEAKAKAKPPAGRLLFATAPQRAGAMAEGALPARCAAWFLQSAERPS